MTVSTTSGRQLPWWRRFGRAIDLRMRRIVLFRPTPEGARRWKALIGLLLLGASIGRLLLGGSLIVDLFLPAIMVSCVVFRVRGAVSVPLAAVLYALTGFLSHDLPNSYVWMNTLAQTVEWSTLAIFVLVTLDRYAAVKRLESRISRDLELARRLQASLIQPDYDFGTVKIRGFVKQTNEVGGDFYYFRPFQEKYVVFCLGDVMGKGIAASLLMAIVMGFMFEWGKKSSSPAFILKKLNTRLRRLWGGESEHPFITLFYAVYDEEARTLTYSVAGHHGALLVRGSGACEDLKTEGIPVGIFEEASFEEGQVTLEPGDRVVLYTDGVTEARTLQGDQFGPERLCALLEENRQVPLDELLKRIDHAVTGHSGEQLADDVAVMVLEVRPE